MSTPYSRDFLVVYTNNQCSEEEERAIINQLIPLLEAIETIHTFCRVYEVIDLIKYKVIKKPTQLSKFLSQDDLKPFQFVVSKN